MNNFITPLKFLITVAGWCLNEWRAKRIESLCEQIKVYQRIAGTGRLPMTNEERSKLAVLGKAIGLEALRELPTMATSPLTEMLRPRTSMASASLATSFCSSTQRSPSSRSPS